MKSRNDLRPQNRAFKNIKYSVSSMAYGDYFSMSNLLGPAVIITQTLMLCPPVIYSITQILAGKDVFLKPSGLPGLIWVQRRFPALFFILCKDVFHDHKGVSENIGYAFASGEISHGTLRNEKEMDTRMRGAERNDIMIFFFRKVKGRFFFSRVW